MENFLWNENPSIRGYNAVKVVNSNFLITHFFLTTLSFVDLENAQVRELSGSKCYNTELY